MPVLSPHRSSSSGLAGSYRSTFSSSSLDRPYYGTSTTSYSPRFSYTSERYTTRSYADSDGRRFLSRTSSITEDGLTSRYREETREASSRRDSLGRDSSITSIREGLETRRDASLTRSDGRGGESRLSSLNVLESVADLRNKYSPANYVPAVIRNRGDSNIARSKTLNDIGLPPIEGRAVVTKKKVNVVEANFNSTSVGLREFPNNTNETDNMGNQDDDNGNRPSVSEMRKRFDAKPAGIAKPTRTSPELTKPKKIADTDTKEVRKPKVTQQNGVVKPKINADPKRLAKKTDSVEARRAELKGGKADSKLETKSLNNHVTNYSSYIPSKELEKGDSAVEGSENAGDADGVRTKKVSKDLSTSPRLNRSPVSQKTGVSPTNGSSSNGGSLRNSVEKEVGGGYGARRDYDEDQPRTYSRASPGKQMGLNGLKNIGNTCFMNSVIQCLSNTKPLLEYVKKDGYSGDINTTISSMKGALIKAFAQVIKELWAEDSSDRVVNTVSLKSQIQRFAPRFMGYSQQDAQEFLRYLLEGLHEDVNRVPAKPTPIHTEIDEKLSDSEKANESWHRYVRRENSKIVDIFVGQLKSTLKCTHCGHCSVTFDPFWDLSLPIPQKTGPVRLSQCLESFTREETLDGDEKPTCSKCKERRKCTKSFTIHKFPKILVIHLKRFSPTERFRGKLSVTVDFPLEGLDMSNYAAEQHTQCRYNLYAISNHSGTTYSGHYTAYCRHPYSQAWHEYNDSRVTSISPKSTVSGEAYVLFYELDSKMAHL